MKNNNMNNKYNKASLILSVCSLVVAIITLIFTIIIGNIANSITISIGEEANYLAEINAPCIYSIKWTDDDSGDIVSDGKNGYFTNSQIIISIKPEKGSIEDIGHILVNADNSIKKIDSLSLMEHRENSHLRSNYLDNNLDSQYIPTTWNYVKENNIIYTNVFVKASDGKTDLWLIIKELDSNSFIIYGYNALASETRNEKYQEAIDSYKSVRTFIIENNI